jgi:glutathione synthase/RimK-type ligase-like ATP-grasp enzyme
VNPYYATVQAERKLLQLLRAKEAGLAVPKTIVTNRTKIALDFLATCPQAIIKPISHGFLQGREGPYSIYTNPIDGTQLDVTHDLFEAPVLLQEKIVSSREIRVTIVGERVFSVAIDKDSAEEIDWRRPETRKRYSLCSLPYALERSLIELNDRLELQYSAMDLIEQGENVYRFLEVNHAGEWMWLESELGIKISDQIIQLLTHGE